MSLHLKHSYACWLLCSGWLGADEAGVVAMLGLGALEAGFRR